MATNQELTNRTPAFFVAASTGSTLDVGLQIPVATLGFVAGSIGLGFMIFTTSAYSSHMRFNRPTPKDYGEKDDDRNVIWNWIMHEDNLLSTRISGFLLAQSILIAIVATLLNSSIELRVADGSIRVELFGLVVALDLAGAALTLVFWYIFNMNENGIVTLTQHLKSVDETYRKLDDMRRHERENHWYFRTIFHKNGPNVVIKNLLAPIVLFIWIAMLIFAIAIFFAD
jgi:hypothetical protein